MKNIINTIINNDENYFYAVAVMLSIVGVLSMFIGIHQIVVSLEMYGIYTITLAALMFVAAMSIFTELMDSEDKA